MNQEIECEVKRNTIYPLFFRIDFGVKGEEDLPLIFSDLCPGESRKLILTQTELGITLEVAKP